MSAGVSLDQPVAPAVEQERLGLGIDVQRENLADEDLMIAGRVALGQPAVEVGDGAVDQRRPARPHGVRDIAEGVSAPRAIAGGLLGPTALHGGTGTFMLGVLLHFFISCSAAAIYYAASRVLGFMTDHAVVCGMFYGIAIFLVMNLVVLPLSALHAKGPYRLAGLIQGLLVHMTIIGLPIALSVKRFSK